ncbi:MAG: SRPBCC family protein [Longimicrobiales bacterium]
MTIIDQLTIDAPVDACFQAAADVEHWPEILPHYRFVRFRKKDGFGTGVVEMSAYRDFVGPLRYPTWWVSDMHVDAQEPAVFYTHIEGVTKGMVVKWSFDARDGGTHVRISHSWDGPPWPLIGRFAWERVIARGFVSYIAARTLAGVAAAAEHRHLRRTQE